ncbi:PepSY-like domain-containing protein [Flavobacterium sp.]|uniref:PepSY-like domain-containing protein n=1 Tax=Flavobacterium sp. TaxID=239 RepID=UPI0040341A99
MRTKQNYSKILVLTALLFGFLANAATVNPKLPEPALDFLKMHFTGYSISQVETGVISDNLYRVTLSDGISIMFDKRGNWKGINGNYRPLPKTILPKGINSHIKDNFKSQMVVKADKKTWGYKILLMDGKTVEYNNTGKFLRINK